MTTTETTGPLDLERVHRLIATAGWQFAKTMPHIPHEYTLRQRSAGPTGAKKDPLPEDDFEWLVVHIREHGYQEAYGKRTFTYLEPGDGWRYWTMGSSVEETTLINRARCDGQPYVEPQGPVKTHHLPGPESMR